MPSHPAGTALAERTRRRLQNSSGAALTWLVALCAAGTGLGAQPLPDRILGTWALEPSDCPAEGAADFRIEIKATEIVFAASRWSSPNWQPLNKGWRALVRVDEEGAGRLKGRHAIALLLGHDGRLMIIRKGEADVAYHRCPPAPWQR